MENYWIPHPKQQLALKSNCFETLYGGARGGGKTDSGLVWLIYDISNPALRCLVIRRNADDLSDWVDRARMMYNRFGATFAYRPAEIRFPSGAVIKTGHLKDENAFTKYQGHEYQRMLIEELTQIPDEKRYIQLISSCRSTNPELPAQIFATTNPGGVGHLWVKKRFIDPARPMTIFRDKTSNRTRIYIPATVDDNPTLVENDPSYVLQLDALKDVDKELWKAWRHGSWDVFAGQFFSEWRDDLHVVEPFPIPSNWERYMAMDWGSNKPFSMGWYARNSDGRTYLYRELYMNSLEFKAKFGKPLTARRLARVAMAINRKNGEHINYCVSDPSMWNKILLGKDSEEGESYAEIMMNAGLPMIRGDNDRFNGWATFREALSTAPDGKPYYQVFSTCADTIRTLPSLVYDSIRVEDCDSDGEDHCADRDRYFFMSRPAPADVEPRREKTIIETDYQKRVRKLQQSDDLNEADETFI
jgi:hypothetical protein